MMFLILLGFSTLFLGIFFCPLLLIPGVRYARFVSFLWVSVFITLNKWLWHIDYHIEGLDYIQKGKNYLIASKHQSMWETFLLSHCIKNSMVVLKRELLWIPIWGWWLARFGVIAIDRKAGSKSLKKLIAQSRKAASDGRRIIIYPEGTRTKIGEQRHLKNGIAVIYEATQLPIIPVALNSGYYFPKKGKKRAGTIQIAFQPPIQAGLERGEMMKRLTKILHEQSEKLIPPC